MKFAHVSFHDMRPGQAARTHVLGLYEALRGVGWGGPLVTPGGTPPGLLGKLCQYLGITTRGRRLLGGVDLLYVRSHPAALPLLRAAHGRGVPVVLEVNGTVADMHRSHPATAVLKHILGIVERAQFRLVSCVVVVSHELADWVRSVAPSLDVLVVPNAADPTVFHPGAATTIDARAPYVAFCGALASWQGIETVLAATRTDAWPPEVSVVIAGDGKLSADVRAEAERNSRVTYVGVVEQEEVAGLLAGSMAGLSPNTRRSHAGDAVKLYEALACGVPVLASNTGSQGDFVREGDLGLVYDAEAPEALALAVRQLLTDDAMRSRFARNAARTASENTWHERAAQIDRFVRSLSTEEAAGR